MMIAHGEPFSVPVEARFQDSPLGALQQRGVRVRSDKRLPLGGANGAGNPQRVRACQAGVVCDHCDRPAARVALPVGVAVLSMFMFPESVPVGVVGSTLVGGFVYVSVGVLVGPTSVGVSVGGSGVS